MRSRYDVARKNVYCPHNVAIVLTMWPWKQIYATPQWGHESRFILLTTWHSGHSNMYPDLDSSAALKKLLWVSLAMPWFFFNLLHIVCVPINTPPWLLFAGYFWWLRAAVNLYKCWMHPYLEAGCLEAGCLKAGCLEAGCLEAGRESLSSSNANVADNCMIS